MEIKAEQQHILIFEPRIEGHHLSWLKYVTEAFNMAGFKLTLALNWNPKTKKLIEKQLSNVISKVSIIPALNHDVSLNKKSKIVKNLTNCFKISGAKEIFINNLDEFISHCLRSATLGIYPPKELRGALSGVYFRPRFLENANWPPGNLIKSIGFRKLCRKGWFNKIYLLDEYLLTKAQNNYAGITVYFLPDPWDGDFYPSKKEARKFLNIPEDRFMLLHYGIGKKRKGLHLTVRALLESPADWRIFLLCAGNIPNDRELLKEISALEQRRQAKVINRYVSDSEEIQCFCASDVVMLPYVKHFGSSGVLSRAAAAGKMVIASNEGLIGRRIREHKLGWLFQSGNVSELRKRISDAESLTEKDLEQFQKAAFRYAEHCSRGSFNKALIEPFK